jgi:hypothetical protein
VDLSHLWREGKATGSVWAESYDKRKYNSISVLLT